MTHPIVRPERRGRGLLFLLVLSCVLLAGALHAPIASAANVPNPNPELIARWEPCEPNTGVTVIVDDHQLGEGKIYVGCAPGEQANGVEALEHAGFQIEGTREYGLAFICRIDGEPTPAEQTCEQAPGAGAYWSYWRGKPGGRWGYSGVGAASPLSRSSINSVEGWGFGSSGAPRILPMDGSGESGFTLPPEQASSVIPAQLAREWLTKVTLKNVSMVEEGAEVSGGEKVTLDNAVVERLLKQAVALAGAGVNPAALKPLAELLAQSCEREAGVTVEGCDLRLLANPEEHDPERFAAAVLGLQALGQNPESFAGMNLRGTVEGSIEEANGEVKRGSSSALSEAPLYTAPVVLALARTGTLSEKALKTVGLIIKNQSATKGSFELGTPVNVEAIQALVAAREQGAGVLGQSRLEEVQAALKKAGEYLEHIQEADGGVRMRESTTDTYDPKVESTALGAVGLALTGHQADAERAAKWVSQYQVTAEYAGTGDPATGELTPGQEVIGAFLPAEGALRTAIAYGVGTNFRGPYEEAQLPTAQALLALETAGPYGPYDAVFDQESLFFESRPIGSPSKLTATLTNQDVRPVTITTIGISGEESADFTVDGGNCAEQKLAPGENCEVQVSFNPATLGLHSALLQVSLEGTSQTIDLTVTGTGTPMLEKELEKETEEKPAGQKETPPTQNGTETPVGGGQSTGVLRVQTPRLDGQGTARGLVGVSWRILEAGSGVKSWTISSKTLGVKGARYVTRATGAGTGVTSALLKLPPGRVYELRFTFTDAQGHSSTSHIGRVVVPEDDRWRGLHYSGHWHRIKQAGAWLDTVTRGVKGARVSVRLAAGRPVFMLRATSIAAKVEVRCGSQRQVFAVAKDSQSVLRQITAAKRAKAGTVSLRVLKGTVDLDGVADEG